MYKKVVIGIDQSYTSTGISVVADGELKLVRSTRFKGCRNKIEKRKELGNILSSLLSNIAPKAILVTIHVERIRTFSQGQNKKQGFGLHPNYLKATGALIGTITDIAHDYGVKVYSVDTRSWKSRIVGSSKGGKQPTVDFIQAKGFNLFVRTNKKGEAVYDDDAADSACIALYGFLKEGDQKLKLEE